jgi:hypothetical protein
MGESQCLLAFPPQAQFHLEQHHSTIYESLHVLAFHLAQAQAFPEKHLCTLGAC